MGNPRRSAIDQAVNIIVSAVKQLGTLSVAEASRMTNLSAGYIAGYVKTVVLEREPCIDYSNYTFRWVCDKSTVVEEVKTAPQTQTPLTQVNQVKEVSVVQTQSADLIKKLDEVLVDIKSDILSDLNARLDVLESKLNEALYLINQVYSLVGGRREVPTYEEVEEVVGEEVKEVGVERVVATLIAELAARNCVYESKLYEDLKKQLKVADELIDEALDQLLKKKMIAYYADERKYCKT